MTPGRWQRIKAAFSAVIQLPTQQQAEFLDSVEGSEVRNEVRRLVDHHRPGTTYLDQPFVPEGFLTTGRRRFQTGDLLAGRFRIERFLGEGGVGEVYAAADLDLGESVAVKTVRPEIASAETLARFRQEIQLSRRVTHPSVCRIFDLFRHEAGGESIDFLTMELLDGGTLAEAIAANGPLPPPEALRLIRHIADGLSAAHRAGVVHRDLKTSNVMLVGSGETSRAVVTDFGLALTVGPGVPEGPNYSAVAGTPAFMAPEQISGKPVTPATDVFAFGVLIYHLVTGTLPYPLETLTRLTANPERPDPVPPRRRLPSLSRRWERAILKCLRTDPAERFPSVAEVVSALAGPPTWRAPLVAIAAASALAAFLVLRPAPQAPPVDGEIQALYQKGQLHARRLTAEEMKKGIAYFQQAIDRDKTFALAYSGLADAYSASSDYGGIDPWDATEKAQKAASEAVRLRPDLAAAHASLGLALSLDLRRWRDSEPSLARAIDLDPAYGPAHQWYAAVLAKTGRTKEAIREIRIAAAADPVSLPISTVVGWMLYFDRQHRAAVEQAHRSIELDPNFRHAYLLLARSSAELGDFETAFRACRRGVDLSGNGAVFTSALACLHAATGQKAQAAQLARELEKRRPKEKFAASHIASIYSLLGMTDDAFQWLERAVAENDSSVLFLKVHPHFDNLRRDPRYLEMLNRVRLAP